MTTYWTELTAYVADPSNAPAFADELPDPATEPGQWAYLVEYVAEADHEGNVPDTLAELVADFDLYVSAAPVRTHPTHTMAPWAEVDPWGAMVYGSTTLVCRECGETDHVGWREDDDRLARPCSGEPRGAGR
jgi:hypothetical protein